MSSQNPSNPFTRPTFPPLQPSTHSQASAFQSYSSTSSLASQSPASSAPLPSPNPNQQNFFASLNSQQPRQQQHHHHQQTQATAQRIPAQRQSSFNDYVPDRTGAGTTAAETATYLNEYALLAEAAKRAQMAVVMRDIEGMEL